MNEELATIIPTHVIGVYDDQVVYNQEHLADFFIILSHYNFPWAPLPPRLIRDHPNQALVAKDCNAGEDCVRPRVAAGLPSWADLHGGLEVGSAGCRRWRGGHAVEEAAGRSPRFPNPKPSPTTPQLSSPSPPSLSLSPSLVHHQCLAKLRRRPPLPRPPRQLRQAGR